MENTYFCPQCQTVMRPLNTPEDKWKPDNDQLFFYIDKLGNVSCDYYRKNVGWMINYIMFGNCFRNEEYAKTVRDKVRVLLMEN